MTIKEFEGIMPDIADSAFVDDIAHVSGDVIIGAESSVWPMAVLRGDMHKIRVGMRTNIQDGAILHGTYPNEYSCPEGFAVTVGDDVTVGHNAILHACTVKDRCLIGMGAVVLDGAIIESKVIVGAGSLVPPEKNLDSGLWLGNPAKRVRALTKKEEEFLLYSAKKYRELAVKVRN